MAIKLKNLFLFPDKKSERKIYKYELLEKNMKKEMKILGIVLISVILMSLVVGVVAAATPYEDFKAWLSKSGDSLIPQKILLFILVALLVYSIANFIPIIENQNFYVKTTISIVVAILATFWLLPAEVYTILQSYSTLGIVLTTFFPLVVLLTFTIELYKGKPEYAIIAKAMWVAFFVILTMKFLSPAYAWLTTGSAPKESGGMFGAVAYTITAVICLIMIFWGGRLSRIILHQRIKGIIEAKKITSDAERAAVIAKYEQLKLALPEEAKTFDSEIEKLQKLKFT